MIDFLHCACSKINNTNYLSRLKAWMKQFRSCLVLTKFSHPIIDNQIPLILFLMNFYGYDEKPELRYLAFLFALKKKYCTITFHYVISVYDIPHKL